jgi:hypothetical protein
MNVRIPQHGRLHRRHGAPLCQGWAKENAIFAQSTLRRRQFAADKARVLARELSGARLETGPGGLFQRKLAERI